MHKLVALCSKFLFNTITMWVLKSVWLFNTTADDLVRENSDCTCPEDKYDQKRKLKTNLFIPSEKPSFYIIIHKSVLPFWYYYIQTPMYTHTYILRYVHTHP